MPCIACTAFTTLRSDHHCNARTPHHCAGHSTLKTPLDTQSPQHALIQVGQDGIRPRHLCPALIVVNFMLHITAHVAMAKFGIRSLCHKERRSEQQYQAGIMPCIACTAFTTLRSDHHCNARTPHHCADHSTRDSTRNRRSMLRFKWVRMESGQDTSAQLSLW